MKNATLVTFKIQLAAVLNGLPFIGVMVGKRP